MLFWLVLAFFWSRLDLSRGVLLPISDAMQRNAMQRISTQADEMGRSVFPALSPQSGEVGLIAYIQQYIKRDPGHGSFLCLLLHVFLCKRGARGMGGRGRGTRARKRWCRLWLSFFAQRLTRNDFHRPGLHVFGVSRRRRGGKRKSDGDTCLCPTALTTNGSLYLTDRLGWVRLGWVLHKRDT